VRYLGTVTSFGPLDLLQHQLERLAPKRPPQQLGRDYCMARIFEHAADLAKTFPMCPAQKKHFPAARLDRLL
jgi:hypothetical protein